MEFEGCLSDGEKNACMQLLGSEARFEPYPHQSKIQLALSPPLFLSLNLTIQHGPCAFSCEGGDLSSCDTVKEDDVWSDASTSFYIENCVASHNYCVTASIGECCPVCTQTVFMEDFHQENYHEETLQWNPELIILTALILILLFLTCVAALKNYYNSGSRSTIQKSQNVIDPLTQHILQIENIKCKTQVVCLYLRENNILFLDMVNSVQEFLRRKGIHVIDIHTEEENINRSITKWVHDVIKEENTKLLLFETEDTRQLWNGDVKSNKVLKPLEQVICYTRSCVPVTNVHNYLFVVREWTLIQMHSLI